MKHAEDMPPSMPSDARVKKQLKSASMTRILAKHNPFAHIYVVSLAMIKECDRGYTALDILERDVSSKDETSQLALVVAIAVLGFHLQQLSQK